MIDENGRPSNSDVCDDFRALMTHGFRVPEGVDRDHALSITKAWRGDLWRAFREIEERLCPVPPGGGRDD